MAQRQENLSFDKEKICRRAWQPTPVFLPGESQGQRSLVGYGPQGCKLLDTTEVTQYTQSDLTHSASFGSPCGSFAGHEAGSHLVLEGWMKETEACFVAQAT